MSNSFDEAGVNYSRPELPALPDMSTIAALLEFTADLNREIYRMDETGTSATMLMIAPLFGELTLKGEKITFKRLQERSGLPKSTLSRTISSLLKAGWIVEAIDPDDRRHRTLMPSTRTIELSGTLLSLTERLLTAHFGESVLADLRDRALKQGAPRMG